MQKKIIALAVAGLVSGAAFAQSNVTIYGTLDIGYLQGTLDERTVNAAGVRTVNKSTDLQSTGYQDGPLSSNNIGFKGSEDLGNGLKATFQIEMGLTEADRLGSDTGPDTAAATTFRKQNIGLSGGFGSVTIGRQGVLIDEAWAVGSAGMKNNAYGDMYSSATGSGGGVSLVTGAAGGNNAFHDFRANELITYVSPNFSGFTVSGQYGTGQTEVDNSGVDTGSNAEHTNWGLRGDYANGPLALVAAYNNEKNESKAYTAGVINSPFVFSTTTGLGVATPASTTTDKDSWLLGANYNFGIVKVFGQYFDGSRDVNTYTGAAKLYTSADADISGWEIGVHVPVTAQITLMGAYFDTSYDWNNKNTAGVTTTKGDGDGMGYQLAGLYSLSKRTTAYAMYGYEESSTNTSASVAKQDADIWNFAVGVRHTF